MGYKSKLLVTIATAILVTLFCVFYISKNKIDIQKEETMILNVYIQNKNIAENTDCSVTKKIVYIVPKTLAVSDVSLKILFKDELAEYGVYDSVRISSGTAKILLKNITLPSGKDFSSLSSCQIGHLLSVLNDTLTQYKTITKIELYTPKGQVEF